MKKPLVLKKRADLKIPATEPFNFKYTVYKPSHFPTSLELYDESEGILYRTLRLGYEVVVALKMSDLSRINKKQGIFAEIYSDIDLEKSQIKKIDEKIRTSYCVEDNINLFYDAISNDENMRRIISNLYGMRNSCFENMFEILNISSMLQNTTVKRSEQMMGAMLNNFGKTIKFDDVTLTVFYTPEDVARSSEISLRELKLGYRAKYLLNIANYFIENLNFEDDLISMDYNDANDALMKIKGIGPYSAKLALFSRLNHLNMINFDVWNTKILSKYHFGTEDRALDEVEKKCDEEWGDFQGYCVLYIIENLFVENPELQYWNVK